MFFNLEIETWNMIFYLKIETCLFFFFERGEGYWAMIFFLEAHYFRRPSSVEFFTLSKERPCSLHSATLDQFSLSLLPYQIVQKTTSKTHNSSHSWYKSTHTCLVQDKHDEHLKL